MVLLFTYKRKASVSPLQSRESPPTVPRKGYCSAKALLSRERGTLPRKLLEKKKGTPQSTECTPCSALSEPTWVFLFHFTFKNPRIHKKNEHCIKMLVQTWLWLHILIQRKAFVLQWVQPGAFGCKSPFLGAFCETGCILHPDSWCSSRLLG